MPILGAGPGTSRYSLRGLTLALSQAEGAGTSAARVLDSQAWSLCGGRSTRRWSVLRLADGGATPVIIEAPFGSWRSARASRGGAVVLRAHGRAPEELGV